MVRFVCRGRPDGDIAGECVVIDRSLCRVPPGAQRERWIDLLLLADGSEQPQAVPRPKWRAALFVEGGVYQQVDG
jgi:hypothetical protein